MTNKINNRYQAYNFILFVYFLAREMCSLIKTFSFFQSQEISAFS